MSFAGTGKIWMNGVSSSGKTRRFTSLHTLSTTAVACSKARAATTRRKGRPASGSDEHLVRLANSAKIYRMEYPLDLVGLARRRPRDDPRQRDEGVLHPAARLSRLRHTRRQPAEQPGRRGHHGVGMGRLPGRRSARTGRRDEGQQLVAHGAKHAAGRAPRRRPTTRIPRSSRWKRWPTATPKASPSTSTATSAKAADRTSSSCATVRC